MSDQSFTLEKAPSLDTASGLPSIYQTYLCSEPSGDIPLLLHNGPDEYTALLRTLQRSAEHFSEKDQSRNVERVQYEIAKLHMQNRQWDRAMRVLVPLWQTLSWRKAGWWNMLEEIDWALKDCAGRVRHAEILLAVQWELMNQSLTPRQDSQVNFPNALQLLGPLDNRPRPMIRAENILSSVSASFAFRLAEGHVGETLKSQVVLASQAHSESSPITIARIKVVFSGLKAVHISHKQKLSSSDAEDIQLTKVSLQKASSERAFDTSNPKSSSGATDLHGLADLVIAPGTVRILDIDNVPREAGDVEVSSISLSISEPSFDVELLYTEEEQISRDCLYVPRDGKISRSRVQNGRSIAAKILPKPPKLRIEPFELAEEHYTDEILFVNLDVVNDEQANADITLDVQIHGSPQTMPTMEWVSKVELAPSRDEDKEILEQKGKLSSGHIGVIPPSGTQRHCICIHPGPDAAEYNLEFKARYFLLTDPETVIEKITTAIFRFQRPFEASHSFSPIAHPAPWPKYFSLNDQEVGADDESNEDSIANGLVQRWSLVSRITSLAMATLIVESVEAKVVEIHEGAICNISSTDSDSDTSPFRPLELKERFFTADVQKTDLEERRTTFVNLRLEIKWCREGSSDSSTITSLALPELVVTFGEPRALAHTHSEAGSPGPILLDYILENPSVYTLTFNLTMNTSDDFAFSGPKNMTIHLIPLSRVNIPYILLPLASGRWISPQLKVFDTHFHKTLKVHGTEGIRNDKSGISIWVDTEG